MNTLVDVEAERLVLSYLLTSLSAFEEGISLTKDAFVGDRTTTIFSEGLDHYQATGGLLDDKALEDRLTKTRTVDAVKAETLLLFQWLKSNPSDKSKFVHNSSVLRELQSKRKLYWLTDQLRKGLTSGNTSEQLTRLVESHVVSASHADVVLHEGSVLPGIEDRHRLFQDRKANPQKYKGTPSGFKRLDELTGGLLPGESALVFGRTSAGKSRFLFSVAFNAFMNGYNFIYVTIEMPKSQIERLFDARAFRISSTGLRQGKLSPEDEKKYMDQARISQIRSTKGDFHIVDVPENCSVATLLPVIRRYKLHRSLHGIVIDYANLLVPTGGGSGDQTRDLLVTTREIKALARRENVVVWTAAQASRAVSNLKIDEVGTEHVGYSDAATWNADLILFLRKEPLASALQKNLDVRIVKYRDGGNEVITLGTDWDKAWVGDFDQFLKEIGAIITS